MAQPGARKMKQCPGAPLRSSIRGALPFRNPGLLRTGAPSQTKLGSRAQVFPHRLSWERFPLGESARNKQEQETNKFLRGDCWVHFHLKFCKLSRDPSPRGESVGLSGIGTASQPRGDPRITPRLAERGPLKGWTQSSRLWDLPGPRGGCRRGTGQAQKRSSFPLSVLWGEEEDAIFATRITCAGRGPQRSSHLPATQLGPGCGTCLVVLCSLERRGTWPAPRGAGESHGGFCSTV